MKITVQLFGHFRKFGDQLQVELPDGSRMADLENRFMRIIEERDALFYRNNNLRASRFCDDKNILPRDHPVNDGQVFSVLPPVSGG
jgi:molybdopterin converting factor small subunit